MSYLGLFWLPILSTIVILFCWKNTKAHIFYSVGVVTVMFGLAGAYFMSLYGLDSGNLQFKIIGFCLGGFYTLIGGGLCSKLFSELRG